MAGGFSSASPTVGTVALFFNCIKIVNPAILRPSLYCSYLIQYEVFLLISAIGSSKIRFLKLSNLVYKPS